MVDRKIVIIKRFANAPDEYALSKIDPYELPLPAFGILALANPCMPGR
jgi:hypothetical protein